MTLGIYILLYLLCATLLVALALAGVSHIAKVLFDSPPRKKGEGRDETAPDPTAPGGTS